MKTRRASRRRVCSVLGVWAACAWLSFGAGVLHAAVPESTVVPSIEFTGFTAFFDAPNLCQSGGSADFAEIDSGFTAGQGDCALLVVPGSGAVSQFCEHGPFSAGNYSNYNIPANQTSYNVKAGTPVTAVVLSANNSSGGPPHTFVSRIAVACDTGHVIGIASFVPANDNCNEGDQYTLCLGSGRFRVNAYYFLNGSPAPAQAVQLTADTGYFYFFDPANVEVIIKTLNGCGLNQNYWVFAGGLTNVQTSIVITDVVSGTMKTYKNPASTPFQPIQDTGAFKTCRMADARQDLPPPATEAVTPVSPSLDAPLPELSANTLPLHHGRFSVSVTWTTADGTSGNGTAYQLTDDTGYFWFFSSSNVEMVIKVLNGCGLNNAYWVFAGGLTSVKVAISVTDTTTGHTQVYRNPQGKAFQPIQDTSAFRSCP
jgi:hypothetical protein